MTDRPGTGAARVLRTVALVSVLVTLGGLATFVAVGHAGLIVSSGFALVLAVASLFHSVMTWVLARSQARNRAVWVMAGAGLLTAVYVAASAAAVAVARNDPAVLARVLDDVYVPADFPTAVAILRMVGDGSGSSGFLMWATLGLMIFPDGRSPSPRWRWFTWSSGALLVLEVIGWAWTARPWSVSQFDGGLLFNVALFGLMLMALVAAASIIFRLRSSSGVAHQQLKWMAWGASILVVGLIVSVLGGGTSIGSEVVWFLGISTAVAIVSYGVAIGRYRLFDIDLVISRTFVYGTLAVGITAAYVAVVAITGQAVGGPSRPNPALALAATGVIAVAFHPVRRRLEKAANRLVYGKRATPYEVLSAFSKRVGAADASILGQVTKTLVDGTAADRAVLRVGVGADEIEAARWPADADGGGGAISEFPILHDGAVLGRLTLTAAPGQRLSEGDVRLVDEVVSGMGLALRNQLLTRTLQARVADLRESRRRLVSVQDATRRKLERDLHDGAQQQLVALKVKLGLARTIAAGEGAADTQAMLDALSEEADDAVGALRDFARGVYPPLLEAEGLRTAIEAQARKASVPVTVAVDGVGRLAPDLEATIYFCVVEALQNATRHAGASRIAVTLTAVDGAVTFSVVDDGQGFDPASAAPGTGLINIEDRLGSAGGEFVLETRPGDGTTVRGTVPVGGAR
jgi:signal transduction histidine kinase